jgi:opacity protein-like surface antigen
MKYIKILSGLTLALSSSLAFANSYPGDPCHAFYIAGDVGIYQAYLNTRYNDVTDLIPANSALSLSQNGYSYGVAIGYSRRVGEWALLGAEASGTFHTTYAYYANAGGYNNTIKIKNNADIVFVPGMFLTDTIASYLKIGISTAHISNYVTSQVGFVPVVTNFSSSFNVLGAAFGIGIKKYICPDFAIFSEYSYHDFGNRNLAHFTNFTASYVETAHIYTNELLVGASYNF